MLARNILFLTLIIDRGVVDSTWDLYYHLYVDLHVARLIHRQIDKLIPLLKTAHTWRKCQYGDKIHFCDESDTIDDVRNCLQHVAEQRATNSAAESHLRFNKDFQRSMKLHETVLDSRNPRFPLGFHSASPSVAKEGMFKNVLLPAALCFWRYGTVRPRGSDEEKPNPLFAAFLSDGGILDPTTNPLLGYHLTTSMAPLTNGSPLKPPDVDNELEA